MIKIKVVRNKQELRFEYFADLSSLGTIFMVAASRMGNMVTPKWCFSDVPFDVNVATRNDLNTSLILPTWYVIMMSVTNDSKITGQADNFARFACESL